MKQRSKSNTPRLRLNFFLILIISAFIFQQNLFAADKTMTISGKVSLPVPAPAEGTTIQVILNIWDGKNARSTLKKDIQFSASETSKPYSLEVPAISAADGAILYDYFCKTGCKNYFDSYPLNNHDKSIKLSKHFLRDDNPVTIDISMAEAVQFSGVISLPRPYEAPAGSSNPLSFLVSLFEVDDQGNIIEHLTTDDPGREDSAEISIKNGESSGAFNLKVTKDPSRKQLLTYACSNCAPDLKIGIEGSYDTELLAEAAHSGIVLDVTDLLSLPQVTVSGNVILPKPAASMGAMIEVMVKGAAGTYKKTISFLKGETTKPYSLDILKTDVSLSYKCLAECDSYYDYPAAKTITANNINQEKFNLDVIEAIKVSGSIVLPQPFKVSSGGWDKLNITVELHSIDEQGETYNKTSSAAIFHDGDSSKPFNFKFKKDTKVKQLMLNYDCLYSGGCPSIGLPVSGFYNSQGSVSTSSEATLLSADKKHVNLAFKITESTTKKKSSGGSFNLLMLLLISLLILVRRQKIAKVQISASEAYESHMQN